MKKTKIICILNPLSCDGNSIEKWSDAEKVFNELNIEHDLVLHAGNLCKKMQEILTGGVPNPTNIVGVGGDGTHNALINGIMKYAETHPASYIPAYAIMPFGTGNNIAKSFNMGLRHQYRTHDSFHDEMRRIAVSTVWGADYGLDLGKIGNTYFANGFAAGMDAAILKERNRDRSNLKKKPFLFSLLEGYSLYLKNVLKKLLTHKAVYGEVEVDGEKKYSGDIFNIIINNTRIYAGEFDPVDTAFANDGRLDILILKGKFDYLKKYLFCNRHFQRKIRKLGFFGESPFLSSHLKGKTFKLKFKEPVPSQIDGEEFMEADEFFVETIPAAIILKVPAEPA